MNITYFADEALAASMAATHTAEPILVATPIHEAINTTSVSAATEIVDSANINYRHKTPFSCRYQFLV